jgi:CheY-like chemotaxis protein
MLLADRTVVIVDPDAAWTDVLSQHLKSHGARCFHAHDAASAAWGVRETLPDVIVSELSLADLDANALIQQLRSSPECAETPALGLSAERGLLERWQALPEPFEKYLLKPARLSDLTDAICCLLGSGVVPDGRAFPTLEDLGDSLERKDYRRLLRTLNFMSAYRYTALIRSDESELSSVWTFDRDSPLTDRYPFGVRIADTPCARVLAERQPVVVTDAMAEGSYRGPQRPGMRAFIGVPWLDDDGLSIGVLCHFDPAPRGVDPAAVDLLERVARLFLFLNRRLGKRPDAR